jgi:hypothetical protein
LQKLTEQATGAALDSVKKFQNKLTEVAGTQTGPAAPTPGAMTLARANGQAGVLYGQIWQADAEPTAAQSEAMSGLERETADVMKRWNAIKTSDLAALNAELRRANLQEIQIESEPHHEDAVMDEE